MVQMPPSNKNEFWNLVLVRVPKNRLGAVLQALRNRAEPQQYGGGWYIKRVEVLEPKNANLKDAYSLSIAVKAATQAAMDSALAEIERILGEASGGTAQWDVYVVTAIDYSANW